MAAPPNRQPESLPPTVLPTQGSEGHPSSALLTLGCVVLLVLAILALAGPEPSHATGEGVGQREFKALNTPSPFVPRRGTTAYRAWIVLQVFGPAHGPKAVAVALCESGLDPGAANGQYLGTFQMGAHERATYGHGHSVWAQARAARRYWRVSRWTPWACA